MNWTQVSDERWNVADNAAVSVRLQADEDGRPRWATFVGEDIVSRSQPSWRIRWYNTARDAMYAAGRIKSVRLALGLPEFPRKGPRVRPITGAGPLPTPAQRRRQGILAELTRIKQAVARIETMIAEEQP